MTESQSHHERFCRILRKAGVRRGADGLTDVGSAMFGSVLEMLIATLGIDRAERVASEWMLKAFENARAQIESRKATKQ